MKYENEVGCKALGLYAGVEHVDVAKKLLTEIVIQIIEDGSKDGLDQEDVHEHAVAGLMLLFMDVAEGTGYLRLEKDIQDLAVDYGISHLA